MLRAAGHRLFQVGNLLLATGFVWHQATPALLSLGTIFVALSFLGAYRDFEYPKLHVSIAALWLLCLISGFYAMDTKNWWNVCSRQLALILIPLGYCFGKGISPRDKRWFAFMFLGNLSLFSFITLIRYLIHKTEIDLSLIESGAIPIWDGTSWPWKLHAINSSQFAESGINHIYFSVLQAISIPLAYVQWKKEKKWYWILFLLINLISMHWFLARTGLLAFYGAAGVLFLRSWKKSEIKISWKWLIVAGLIPFIAYFTLSAVRNKVDNSITDIQMIGQGDDINHRSFAMRIEAWKTAIDVILSSPVVGVSSGDIAYRMNEAYIANDSPLWEENRIPPHNQYLETTASYGILGLLCISLIFYYAYRQFNRYKNRSALFTLLIFGFAFLFESMLQTQVGVCMFPFFLLFYYNDPDEGFKV